jgi:hypothetical protein
MAAECFSQHAQRDISGVMHVPDIRNYSHHPVSLEFSEHTATFSDCSTRKFLECKQFAMVKGGTLLT